MALIKPEQLRSGSYSITGSFTGSFYGDGSGLTNLPIPLIDTGSFVTTSSFNSYTGSNASQFAGTASFATNALSASYAISASYEINYETSSSYADFAVSASHALTASYVELAQTASNILGGKATHVPFFITDTTLATSSIYQSGSATVIINQDNATSANPEALYVWQPSPTSINVISGKGNLNNYLQLNIQNTNQGPSASSDIVATANNGNETINYIDMGINSENYSQNFIGSTNDAYLYSTGNHLHIGNATPGMPLMFFVGGTEVDAYTKLILNDNDQHLMTGSLDVSGSITAFSFTGSLQGNATTSTTADTASYSTTLGASLSQPSNNQVSLLNSAGGTLNTVTVDNVVSASHADNASTANYAAIAGNGGVTQITAGVGVTLIPSNGQGNVTVIATGTGGVTIISGSLVTGSFINTNSYTFNHNLGTRTPIITVFDSNYNQIIPENIQLVDSSSAVITFPTLESGFAIGSTGGTTGTALSSSYALIAEYANTASFYQETDPVYIAQKPTLATTGSNIFRGNQIVTGSLFTSGSNALIGSTTLTGSLNVSGSQNFNGSSSFSGNHVLSGSNTIRGNTFMFGNIQVSGSSNFNNSEFIVTGSTSILGNFNVKGTSVFSNTTFTVTGSQYFTGSSFINGNQNLTGNSTITGSLNVIGDINVVSGSSFTRWGNKLFNYGAFSDTTTQTGAQNTILSMSFNTTDIGGAGVSIVDNTKITVDNTGIYNLQFSAQFDRTTSGTDTITVWFAYTGSSIPNSATDVLISGNAANNPVVASWNYVLPMSASSYIEIYWSHNDNEPNKVELKAVPTRTGPARPAVPSVIATLTQIA